MTYQPPVGFSGEVTLTVETTDGDGATDTDSFKISISAVNDAPVVSLPASQSVAKEGTLTFNAANGNALSITDDASAEASIVVQLSVSIGTLKLGQTTGLTMTAGADASATITFSRVAAAVSALEGLTYMPSSDFSGSDLLQVRIDDQGTNGSGGAQETIASIDITVTAVNDIPVNAVPGAQTTDEDVPLVFSSNYNNALTVSDPDEDDAEGSLAVSLK